MDICSHGAWHWRRTFFAEVTPCSRKSPNVIAQAQEWFRLLASGNAASTEEIAGREGCTASYVIRVVQLAFLAPDLVDRIARGDQPAELSATKLAHMVPLPVGWADQRTALGMQT